MSVVRAAAVSLLLVATSVFTSARTAPAPRPAALDDVPRSVAGWTGADAAPLDPDTMRELAADAYVTRSYEAAALSPVGLYIAFYGQQRPNVSIHSPLHCLPGTGWEPLDVSTVDVTGPSDRARRMLVRKGMDRAVVLYWYEIHGHVVADEIASKFRLLRDSLLYGRSDAALVRLSVPVMDSTETADRDALAFARALLPSVTF